MKSITLLLLSVLLLASTVKCDYENIADEDSFIMEIIRKHDPEQKLYFSKSQYIVVLQDIIKTGMNLAGQEFNEEHIEQLMGALEDFVQQKPEEADNNLSYKDVFTDLTSQFVIFLQENIKKYQNAYQIMYDDGTEILPPLDDEDSQKETENIEDVEDL